MIPYSTQLIEQDDIDAVVEVLKSPFLTQGAKVEEFEKALCSYTGSKHAVVFNSATSALLGAYTVCEIKKDDEIITTPISFVATSNMFISLGAKPIWCDIKLDGNMDERLLEKLITPRTKAIVGVDFAGKPLEFSKIREIANKHNLLFIDDASHALGSSVEGQKVGSLSDMTILSFHAIKPITTGEGGAVLTDSDEWAAKLRLFRSHGMVKKELWSSDMVSLGHNFRLTEIAAALGISQLKKLDSFVKTRNEIAAYYDERFKDEKLFITQKIPSNTLSARHLYPIILNSELQCAKEDIFKELQARGLGVQVHYKPIYQNSFYKEHFGDISLQVADDFYKSEISIPCHQKMTQEDASFVADTFLEVLGKYSHRGSCF
ncbi:UDP-4-amino-4,6-dideoxy-N-acetyl-beta-L-altrosamine transaminase [Sulfurimonas sp. RIFOXYB12_FULL_35_9]|uniref:UDP-4-amino-4, 6-dideoxy-N-acetyl-beta-L-altrosamine transaminase n=1 Tax=Sulfurimonas sp. RIFOXYB12_FULL_35_9 TaxID=1802256 RepID=UPI0008AC63BD|nr:UDP-4-amino-4,6-dideoxy-N-acetyl-beta-L-altrosamine transaminase [Sulfurimonas sp. RIFOXYB12_FULL_35_9]MBS4068869.1 UDP-4-amino-4,6-dideoxy-N-acetyl-beta-L-altrosamine transaminase [Sulfurimonas sp.]OHE03443.1 MAG: UDP-4-amino-4,6-dideoxy-N-acetyl-beta-L-altrosamine transaminase [Sulfurimonas sp. RIFOXYB12_FULL_35_9]